MKNKIGQGVLVLILTAGVILGAYLGFVRHLTETQDRTVELVVDLNDLKKMAAYEKKPLALILEKVREAGISEVGVFEETLPDALALGEVYYVKGMGVRRLNLLPAEKVKPDRTYVYAPEDTVRKRICNQLKWALGEKAVRFLSQNVMEIDEQEEELRTLGLGISESQHNFLTAKGFKIVPRLWNDPHYHVGNIGPKISGLKGYDLVIFDGEEILGYPNAILGLASALKETGIRYGYIEIVKQEGDRQLKKLMGREVVRVHSVPKDELKKINKEEALDRFLRAVRERGVRLIYIRPFLPPQIEAFPVDYNLKYFGEIRAKIEEAGFFIGKAKRPADLRVKGWQVVILGAGVIIGGLFLLSYFIFLPIWLMYFLLLLSLGVIIVSGAAGYGLFVQKVLAFSAAIIFPSYAVISTFAKSKNGIALQARALLGLIVNVLAEAITGIFLLIGLLADYRFLSGVETFPAVKLALVLPLLVVACYFILKPSEGGVWERVRRFLSIKVSLLAVFLGLLALAALAVLVARSGNFTLPVPGIEKLFRNWLETLLFVRPRTKEFLVGYPFLFLAAAYYLKGGKTWLWLLTTAGTIAPVSVFNSFSHIHTPILISIVRTFNGLVLGILFGSLVFLIVERFIFDKIIENPTIVGEGSD